MTSMPIAPTRAPRPRWQRVAAPLATIGTLGMTVVALHLRDPHQSGSWGLCPSALVGIWCPGCGGLRAVNDLTNLRIGDAASSNLLLVVLAPFVVLLLARWSLEAWHGGTRPTRWTLTTVHAAIVLGALAAFTVLRNLPGFGWFAP